MESTKSKPFYKRYFNAAAVLIGLISAVIGIYVFFFPETKKVFLEYEILSNSNVFDINTELSNLDIIYDSTSLKKNSQNLRVYNVRIKNNGSETILSNYYDDKVPFGLTIIKGWFIEIPQIINTSNEYLQQNAKAILDGKNKIIFNQVILESGESFTLKLLVLHQLKDTPVLTAVGKIAGQNKIPVLSLIQPIKAKESFWKRTFNGNVLSQLLRGISYFLATTLIVISIAGLNNWIYDKRQNLKRKKLIKEFKKTPDYEYTQIDEVVFSNYQSKGLSILTSYLPYLNDEAGLRDAYPKWQIKLDQYKENMKFRNDERKDEQIYMSNFFFQEKDWEESKQDKFQEAESLKRKINTVNRLIKAGFIFSSNGKLIVNQQLKTKLESFIGFIKKKIPDGTLKTEYIIMPSNEHSGDN